MFQHFDAAIGHRVQPWHAATVFVSAAAHLAAIATLVHLPAPPVMEWTAEEIAFLAVLSTAPPPPAEAPPTKAEPRPARAAAPEPATPPEIPAPVETVPDELPLIEAKLALPPGFEPVAPALAGSGNGNGEGLHLDSIALIPALDFPFPIDPAERFRLPRLRNRDVIVGILTRRYPRRLAYRGLSSAATLRLAIDERGVVDPGSVKVIAFDREEFALVVMDVARRFRFTPARYRDQNVPVIIDIPVQWVAGP